MKYDKIYWFGGKNIGYYLNIESWNLDKIYTSYEVENINKRNQNHIYVYTLFDVKVC
jgi:hypothetical protein